MLGGTNSNSQLIKNLDVTLTENGTFVSGEDYTGFGTVTVAVPPDVMDAELKTYCLFLLLGLICYVLFYDLF